MFDIIDVFAFVMETMGVIHEKLKLRWIRWVSLLAVSVITAIACAYLIGFI